MRFYLDSLCIIRHSYMCLPVIRFRSCPYNCGFRLVSGEATGKYLFTVLFFGFMLHFLAVVLLLYPFFVQTLSRTFCRFI